MAVTSIRESGFLFEPGQAPWFRLQDQPGFALLKGRGVCEMDFGWYGALPGGAPQLWLRSRIAGQSELLWVYGCVDVLLMDQEMAIAQGLPLRLAADGA